MILIHIDDSKLEKRALGALAGRFSFKTTAAGELLVPEGALAFLAREGISFTVQGLPRYDQCLPTVRDPVAPPV